VERVEFARAGRRRQAQDALEFERSRAEALRDRLEAIVTELDGPGVDETVFAALSPAEIELVRPELQPAGPDPAPLGEDEADDEGGDGDAGEESRSESARDLQEAEIERLQGELALSARRQRAFERYLRVLAGESRARSRLHGMNGVRKLVTVVEEIRADGGVAVDPPVRVAAAAAVVANTLAGAYVEDLSPLAEEYCEPLGRLLVERALEALGGPAEGYGKGALVGLDGEVEHGSAILHNLTFGNPVRDAVDGTSLLPSAEKCGGPGATLDLAVKHISDHKVRSHHQTFEVRVPDAPRPDEIVIWVVLAGAGRPHARLPEFGSELAAKT
jgi:hypothetical protein